MSDFSHSAAFEVGQKVKLKIIAQTELGYKAVIEDHEFGVLYANEVFQQLRIGQELSGFIKKIREDGKIDLTLYREGHKAGDDIAPRILELLEIGNGFLPLHEKTPPEKIYEIFGVSKKKYKIALGGLYKKRLIRIDEDGIHQVKKAE